MNIHELSRLEGRSKLEYLASHMDQYRNQDIGPCEIVEYRRGGQSYHNLYAPIPSTMMNTTSIAMTAHHDTVNKKSDNCLDNTASVYNLAAIHNELATRGTKQDIVIAITDAEETCNPTINGVSEMLITYDPDYMIDFELTASGGQIISTQYGQFDLFKYIDIIQPYNNAKAAWGLRKGLALKLRGTSCVAMVSEDDLLTLRKGKSCRRWSQCHSIDDSFDKWLDLQAMQSFQSHFVQKFSMPQSDVLNNRGDCGYDERATNSRGMRHQIL